MLGKISLSIIICKVLHIKVLWWTEVNIQNYAME